MTIEVIRSALAWCTVINCGLLLWWSLFFTLAHDWILKRPLFESEIGGHWPGGISSYRREGFRLFERASRAEQSRGAQVPPRYRNGTAMVLPR